MNAAVIFEKLNAHPILQYITLDGVVTLMRLASHLKRDILQPQSIPESNSNIAPTIIEGMNAQYSVQRAGRGRVSL